MMRSWNVKLVAAFLVVSLVGTGLVAGYMAYTTTSSFGRYVDDQYSARLSERWGDYYRLTGSWQGVSEAFPTAVRVVSSPDGPVVVPVSDRPDASAYPPPDGPAPQPGERIPLPAVALVDVQGNVLVGGGGFGVQEVVPKDVLQAASPIAVEGATVGYMVVGRAPGPRINPRHTFLAGFYRLLGIGGAVATALALALGVVLARQLTRPLRALTTAAHAMARGELEQQIRVPARDELGELARSFNTLSSELVRAQDARRQMTADIAHELRTPLSLILGHAEALADGILPPTPQTLAIIYDEAQRLTRLVDDLRTLSLSDAGELRLQPGAVLPEELVERARVAYSAQAAARQIRLETEVTPELPEAWADPDRVAQVLGNLLANALRLSPKGSRIRLTARAQGEWVRLAVQDEGPGVPPEERERIFDRFYRGDAARNRASGGTGLGLSIARQIVRLHGGEIGVVSASGAGAEFWFTLPVA